MKNKCKLTGCFLFIICTISLLVMRMQYKCINYWKEIAEKNRSLFVLMNQWIYLKQEGKKLDIYFTRNNYRKIAIYGMGSVGLCLTRELKHSDVEILYGIDRNAASMHLDIKVVTMEEDLPIVDAIVVTVMRDVDEIADALSEKVKVPIIAIEDILNEV